MKIKPNKFLYVGVDLHKEKYVAVVIDCWNEKRGEITFDNRPSAFPPFVQAIKKHLKRGQTLIYGLEDTGGFGRSLALFLRENDYIVKEVNPKLSSDKRSKQTTIEKYDSWDAECVARVVRDDWHRLPDANPLDQYWAIGQMVKVRAGLVAHYTATIRRLHQQISYHYPSYRHFFSEVDGKTALAFWEKYPSPRCLHDVSEAELAEFLKRESNRFLSLSKARQIKQFIDDDGHTERAYQNQRDMIVQSLVRSLRSCKEEMRKLENELGVLLGDIGCTLDSMPGIDEVTAACFVAEIGAVERFASAEKLARFAGIAPVRFGTGGKDTRYKSKQGNRVLHELFKQLAIRQLVVAKKTKQPHNAYLLNYFEQKIAEGKSKRQAIVCLMRKLVNVVYHLLKHKTIYQMPAVPEKQAG
ncbi:IS110 family transposase [Cohnella thermotolerans]|uniref:IS110 family transposase n=1 Tax=Cohnella thermotolerans TaxID=329858 RepID=UPI0012EC5047|nr:IS110 family transposase [Cohnella thermotolerans]